MQVETIELDLSDLNHVDHGSNWDINVQTVVVVFVNKVFHALTVHGRMAHRPTVVASREYDSLRRVPDWAAPWTVYLSWEIE